MSTRLLGETAGGAAVIDVNAPAPLVTPQAVKDAAVREYVGKAGLLGLQSLADVERFAKEELELVDAYKRETKTVAKKPDGNGGAFDKQNKARNEFAAEKGLRYTSPHETENAKAIGILGVPAHMVSERWSYAMGRIFRILQGDAAVQTTDLHKKLEASQCPELAKEFTRLFLYYSVLRSSASKHNPFLGLSDADAARVFVRKTIDICDRSTGALGYWWFK